MGKQCDGRVDERGRRRVQSVRCGGAREGRGDEGRGDAHEEGQVLLLGVGAIAVVAALVLVVASATAVPLDLTTLTALADQAPEEERLLLTAVADELIEALRPDGEERIVVAGTANLARATPDFSSLGPLLDAVEEQVVLLRLFAEDASSGASCSRASAGMRVSIGSENRDDVLAEASVVTTSYEAGAGDVVAHLGVIGPTRMDYPAAMAAVRAVARYLSRFLTDTDDSVP